MGNKKVSLIYSWPVIIIATIIFWPIAIYLIYKRVKTDKKAGLKVAGTVVKGLSYFCFFVSLAGIVTLISGEFAGGDFILLIFFLGAAISLFMYARAIEIKAEKYKKYISIIINGNETKINNIAQANGVSVTSAICELKEMIKEGYFHGAYIDEDVYEIVLLNGSKEMATESKNQLKQRIVICNYCGAKNKVGDTYAECDYCDLPL